MLDFRNIADLKPTIEAPNFGHLEMYIEQCKETHSIASGEIIIGRTNYEISIGVNPRYDESSDEKGTGHRFLIWNGLKSNNRQFLGFAGLFKSDELNLYMNIKHPNIAPIEMHYAANVDAEDKGKPRSFTLNFRGLRQQNKR